MRDQIQTLVADMEMRLIISARDIQATQEVRRYAATQHDVQILMDQVVRRVTDLFPNIYHAQIFLLDEDKRFAVLRASTGDAGAKLLERGHRLSVGGISIIGQVTAEGRIVIGAANGAAHACARQHEPRALRRRPFAPDDPH
jgi:hypothetical protein